MGSMIGCRGTACRTLSGVAGMRKWVRQVVNGTSSQGRLLVVAFAERPPCTRLISARQATREERRRYEEEG